MRSLVAAVVAAATAVAAFTEEPPTSGVGPVADTELPVGDMELLDAATDIVQYPVARSRARLSAEAPIERPIEAEPGAERLTARQPVLWQRERTDITAAIIPAATSIPTAIGSARNSIPIDKERIGRQSTNA